MLDILNVQRLNTPYAYLLRGVIMTVWGEVVLAILTLVPGGEGSVALEPHACVPTATCLVLAYFGQDAAYREIRSESTVLGDGSSPISDLMECCRRRGLKTAAFRDVSLLQVKSWLHEGFAVVAVPSAPGKNHAVAMFCGEAFVSDLLTPLHRANHEKLNQFLNAGMVCVVVGESEPKLIPWRTTAVLSTVLIFASVRLRRQSRRAWQIGELK